MDAYILQILYSKKSYNSKLFLFKYFIKKISNNKTNKKIGGRYKKDFLNEFNFKYGLIFV